MNQELLGRVIEDSGGNLRIAIDEEEACHSCGLRGSCANKEITVEKSELNHVLNLNDTVQLVYGKLWQTSALLYIFPLLVFFAGIVLAPVLFDAAGELMRFFIGILAMGTYLLLIRIFSKRLSADEYKIKITPYIKENHV